MFFAVLRQRDTLAADLARLLACWLVVILLAQGLAALQTLVRGPAHRHAPVSQDVMASLEVRVPDHHGARSLTHSQTHSQTHTLAHTLTHARGEVHHHAADEVALPADGEAGLDAAACVLMATLAALAVKHAWPACPARVAPLAAPAWAFSEHDPSPPRRPPRG